MLAAALVSLLSWLGVKVVDSIQKNEDRDRAQTERAHQQDLEIKRQKHRLDIHEIQHRFEGRQPEE